MSKKPSRAHEDQNDPDEQPVKAMENSRGFHAISGLGGLPGPSARPEETAAITALAAGMAHEINNPLHYINNYLYLLSEALPGDFAKREYLDKIQTGIDSLVRLTRDLIDFSQPPEEPFARVDLDRIINTALELNARPIRENKIQIVKNLGPGESPVMGSRRMLHLLFMNLIQNALDATAPGGRIEVTTRRDQARIEVFCEDTGSGISPGNIARIFDPFFTTKKSMEHRGTGLGLAICYNIVKQHQGDISVSSGEGRGTRFFITLPAATEEQQIIGSPDPR
jgi:signal transduction histidine kinase